MDATPAKSGHSSKRSVLLIGGTGYVGTAMRTVLREAGHQVTLLVRSTAAVAHYQQEGFATVRGDVANAESLIRAMKHSRPDAVINLVAIIREDGKATFENVNYRGSLHVVDAARAAGVSRILQMSALGAGNLPDYPYHYTKWKAENYVKDSGLIWTIFRPSIVFGPGQHAQFVGQLADVIKMKLAPVIPVVGDGTSRFQPVHLNDVAASFERALRDPETTASLTCDLAGPDVLAYEDILDECARVLGSHKRKLHVPVALMTPAAAAMGAIPWIEAPVTTDQLKMLQLDNTTEHNAVPMLIGRTPIPFHGNIGYIAG